MKYWSRPHISSLLSSYTYASSFHESPSSTILCYPTWFERPTLNPHVWGGFSRSNQIENLITGSIFQHQVSYTLLGEGLAVRDDLVHALNIGFIHIWLHSDSQELIRLSKENFGILYEIVSLSFIFMYCHFIFIKRAFNGTICTIAKAFLYNGSSKLA